MAVSTLTPPAAPSRPTEVAALVRDLEANGIVRLPRLVSDEILRDMQQAFASRLQAMRWNNVDGYERGERMRLTVNDVLTLAQGFVDITLHPLVTGILDGYLGVHYELREAKGWQSQPTTRDFHGWHSDAWYDQTKVTDRIPREVKLAFYLNDVTSGAFEYVQGTHGQKAPFHLKRDDVQQLPLDRKVEILGAAGSAVLFDTSGIHRQAIPILQPRRAIFYNYHDPRVPLQKEDVDYYRYHPLLLNAAFLGDLTADHMRLLGFGNKTHYQPNFVRGTPHRWLHAGVTAAHGAKLFLDDWSSRVTGKIAKALRLR